MEEDDGVQKKDVVRRSAEEREQRYQVAMQKVANPKKRTLGGGGGSGTGKKSAQRKHRQMQKAAEVIERIKVLLNDSSQAICFVDGASRGNPGPGGSGAVLVSLTEHPRPRAVKQSLGHCTNNIAELVALKLGLALLKIHHRPGVVTDWWIWSDSSYVRGQLVEGWRRTANQELLEELETEWHHCEQRYAVKIHLEWTPGHSGVAWNGEVDRLASTAGQEQKDLKPWTDEALEALEAEEKRKQRSQLKDDKATALAWHEPKPDSDRLSHARDLFVEPFRSLTDATRSASSDTTRSDPTLSDTTPPENWFLLNLDFFQPTSSVIDWFQEQLARLPLKPALAQHHLQEIRGLAILQQNDPHKTWRASIARLNDMILARIQYLRFVTH